MNSNKIDCLVDQVVDRHKKLANARRLDAKSNKCKQKSTVGAMVDAHPVAAVLTFYIGIWLLFLIVAGILAATCGQCC